MNPEGLCLVHSFAKFPGFEGSQEASLARRQMPKLQRAEGIAVEHLPKNINTFGWSAEDVLYRVFSVRTTRNYYMEVELKELLYSISENKGNKDKLKKILTRLEKVKLNEEDPLNLILEKAKTYIDKI